MSHHHSLPLGDACTFVPGNPHLTRCAVNVAHCIDAMPEAMGMDGFAFIGLQEASLWWEWRDLAPRSLAQGDRAGDYVFDSAGPAADQIPPNYPPGKLQSGSPAGGRPAAGCPDAAGRGGGFTRPGINGRTA